MGSELGDLGDDGVVNNTAILVGENRERPGSRLEALDVGNHESLQEIGGVGAFERKPTHVGDIEQAAVGAAIGGGLHDAVLVLNGHGPPGERHHLAAVLDVVVIQHRLLQLLCRGGVCVPPPGGLAHSIAPAHGLPELRHRPPHHRAPQPKQSVATPKKFNPVLIPEICAKSQCEGIGEVGDWGMWV